MQHAALHGWQVEQAAGTVLVKSSLDSRLHQRAGAGWDCRGNGRRLPDLPATSSPAQPAEPRPLSRAWR